jgi:hypothetical protein
MLNPHENNPNITAAEVALVMRIHDAILTHSEDGTSGYCGLGALMVVGILGATDYDIMDGRGHWWARNKQTGAILDPTADQFKTDDGTGEANARAWHYDRRDIVHVVEWDYVMSTYAGEWDEWAEKFVAAERAPVAQRRSA